MAESRQTYTKEQLATLEGLKQEGLRLGAARPEYVNHVLNPDGTVDDDPNAMLERARGELSRLLALEPKTPEVLRSATRASELVAEIDDHIGQQRFLFVTDDNGLPLIYFQCAVPGNLDVFPPEESSPAQAEA